MIQTVRDLLQDPKLEITDCRVICKETKGGGNGGPLRLGSRMFCFLGFRDEATAERVVQGLSGRYFGTRKMDVSLAFAAGDTNIPRPWSRVTKLKEVSQAAAEAPLVEGGKRKEVKGEGERGAEEGGVDEDLTSWLQQKTKGLKVEEKTTRQKSATLAAENGRLRILNLPYETSQEEIVELASRFGQVSSVVLPLNQSVTQTGKGDSSSGPASSSSAAGEKGPANRGFAFVEYLFPDAALNALINIDGILFQGRVLRAEGALPLARESAQDSGADLSGNGDPQKKTSDGQGEGGEGGEGMSMERVERVGGKRSQAKKLIEMKKRQKFDSMKAWNILYVSNAVGVEVMANQLKIDKDEMFGLVNGVQELSTADATGAHQVSFAARAALAETLVLQQVSEWLKEKGFDLEQFEARGSELGHAQLLPHTQRSSTALIVKHLPLNPDFEALRALFERYGQILDFSHPPTQTLAYVRYATPAAARKAYESLLLSPFGPANARMPLLLEYAPRSARDREAAASHTLTLIDPATEAAKELMKEKESATLFVSNINFATTEASVTAVFSQAPGFRKFTLKTTVKKDDSPKAEKKIQSMGYGFAEFDSATHAASALRRFAVTLLDDHKLALTFAQPAVRPSPSTGPPPLTSSTMKPAAQRAAEESDSDVELEAESSTEKKDKEGVESEAQAAERRKAKRSIAVKNISFYASKADIRQLFETFGSVLSVRLPQNKDGRNRGFAFVEFATSAEAKKALEGLKNTHVLGRHLVLERANK